MKNMGTPSTSFCAQETVSSSRFSVSFEQGRGHNYNCWIKISEG